MIATDAIMALVSTMRGSRPQSLYDGEAEDVLNIVLALTVELCASNDRIDRLEREISAQRDLPVEAFRDLRDDGAAATERQQATDAMLARVLRILLDVREPVDRSAGRTA
ncbi:MAG: hypothetical protein ABIR77_07975 [Sphingomicrobium sp.]